ncbi:hypothetical protein CYMTET_6868 [Cymbomonas tetramitiformis]|uniref:Protein phosphatase n=1 Tax=Cymbomonas tetramitiformis TaxID=36881 RepID=A0AAE0GWC4_9CHLO|nr:hypothetical protein CYMTET_6868 [Cymbomonas tetramitiformis]
MECTCKLIHLLARQTFTITDASNKKRELSKDAWNDIYSPNLPAHDRTGATPEAGKKQGREDKAHVVNEAGSDQAERKFYKDISALTALPLLAAIKDPSAGLAPEPAPAPGPQRAGRPLGVSRGGQRPVTFPHDLARKGPMQLFGALAVFAVSAVASRRDSARGAGASEVQHKSEVDVTRKAMVVGAASFLLADVLVEQATEALRSLRRKDALPTLEPDWLPRRAPTLEAADLAALASAGLAAADASWRSAQDEVELLLWRRLTKAAAIRKTEMLQRITDRWRQSVGRIHKRRQTTSEAGSSPSEAGAALDWPNSGGETFHQQLLRQARRALRRAGKSAAQMTEKMHQKIRSRSGRTGRPYSLVAAGVTRPRPDKAHYGGEDAWFVSCQQGTDCMGVADGVSGWNEVGVNPKIYAEKLMRTAKLSVDSGMASTPSRILSEAYDMTAERGSCTACVATIHPDGWLHASNIGDTCVMVLRGERVVMKSTPQMEGENCPLQLACLELLNEDEYGHTPKDAMLYSCKVQPGDVVLLASDGLFDNLTDKTISSIVTSTSAGEYSLDSREAVSEHAHKMANRLVTAAFNYSQQPHEAVIKAHLRRKIENARRKHFLRSKGRSVTASARGLVAQCFAATPEEKDEEEEEDAINFPKPDDITCVVGIVSAESLETDTYNGFEKDQLYFGVSSPGKMVEGAV